MFSTFLFTKSARNRMMYMFRAGRDMFRTPVYMFTPVLHMFNSHGNMSATCLNTPHHAGDCSGYRGTCLPPFCTCSPTVCAFPNHFGNCPTLPAGPSTGVGHVSRRSGHVSRVAEQLQKYGEHFRNESGHVYRCPGHVRCSVGSCTHSIENMRIGAAPFHPYIKKGRLIVCPLGPLACFSLDRSIVTGVLHLQSPSMRRRTPRVPGSGNRIIPSGVFPMPPPTHHGIFLPGYQRS